MLKIENLTKKYNKILAVDDINLEIKDKEIYGFIGPNGSGKSTTIRTILHLIKATKGKTYIDGQDTDKEIVKILNNIGYLPSELNYYDKMKGIDILKYSEKFYKKDCSKRRDELSKLLDFDLYKKIEDYSYGNRKKLGIIDALQHEPKMIIFDEPTSGLDPLIQRKLFKVLQEARDNGATIMFSSHVLSEVQKICDKVAIIKEGKIIKTEDINDFKKNNVKKITLQIKENIEKIDNDNITDFKKNEIDYTFLFRGDVKNLLKIINEYDVIDLNIEEPDLEEIFIHYYE